MWKSEINLQMPACSFHHVPGSVILTIRLAGQGRALCATSPASAAAFSCMKTPWAPFLLPPLWNPFLRCLSSVFCLPVRLKQEHLLCPLWVWFSYGTCPWVSLSDSEDVQGVSYPEQGHWEGERPQFIKSSNKWLSWWHYLEFFFMCIFFMACWKQPYCLLEILFLLNSPNSRGGRGPSVGSYHR